MDLTGPAGRFLHVNLNTRDVERATAFYAAVAGLTTVMRTKPVPTRGEVFGVEGIVLARAHFLYDQRGPRRAPALELVQWDEPKTWGSAYPDPTRPGLHALCLTAPDPSAAARIAADTGGTVIAEGPTTIRPGHGVVVLDPDGVQVEIAPADGPSVFAGIRLHCTDLDKTIDWYGKVGFGLVTAPEEVEWPGAGFRVPGSVRARAATLALPEDRDQFTVRVLQLLDPEPAGASYPAGPHVGMFRSALRVEDIAAGCDRLREAGVDVVGPKAYRLAGTKVGDMKIAFVTDPDGVLAELIERPAKLFGPGRPAG
ncbi:MAG TPA: VOC family protein [Pseudonocardia sp.]|jgi:catechol 2,3-dioxygenase-like lactoylglutathione lyase family enzyme